RKQTRLSRSVGRNRGSQRLDVYVWRKFQKFPEGRQALFLILLQAGNDGTRRFLESRLEDESFGTSSEDVGEALGKMSLGFAAPLERTKNTGGDLDLLRFEFLATGHREPIIRIIDVLEW